MLESDPALPSHRVLSSLAPGIGSWDRRHTRQPRLLRPAHCAGTCGGSTASASARISTTACTTMACAKAPWMLWDASTNSNLQLLPARLRQQGERASKSVLVAARMVEGGGTLHASREQHLRCALRPSLVGWGRAGGIQFAVSQDLQN